MSGSVPSQRSLRSSLTIFVPAVFLSAFLIFQIQPLISKYILPWYGGTPAVWTTCLIVFQSLLFAGYLYAHLIGRLSPTRQTAVHLSLLLFASMLTIVPGDTWKPAGDENPLLRILMMLLVTVGLPYFALSATGPLLQLWFWRAHPDRSPYPLYACSNVGSLLALLSYPVLVEPLLAGREQAAFWRIGFLLFVALCAGAAWVLCRRTSHGAAEPPRTQQEPIGDRARPSVLLWVAWSACSVVLFMAVTNQLTLNVASVPFLWVVPLSVYLLTFILTFGPLSSIPRWLRGALLASALLALYGVLQSEVAFASGGEFRIPMIYQIAIYIAALFLLCLVCHAELFRLRPEPQRLTTFYLCIAFGGMIGGLIVGVLAPLLFLLYQELHLGMLASCVLFLLSWLKEPDAGREGSSLRRLGVPAVVALLLLAWALSHQTMSLLDGALSTRRSFYGLLRVKQVTKGGPSSPQALELYDGSTLHGYQFLHPELRRMPTVYYTARTGIGNVMQTLRREEGRRVGVVGLGIGTLAAYGLPDDYLRFYEINPDVVEIARDSFTFLEQCPATWEIALGDARLKLEAEPGQQFDILVLDAFSSDSIPVHLLTLEAFEVYRKHLAPGGVVAVHVSNLHLDLSTIVYRIAEAHDYHALEIHNRDRYEEATLASTWMILSRDARFLQALVQRLEPLRRAGDVALSNRAAQGSDRIRAWTDHRSSMYPILR